ncbi:uncharacterized protein VICG_00571 [Vittaforma corneae ATCC 50505]|uniref:NADP-dependent oxidoreductase domain-containing protein n=1 Tax=Vittaforma corneae (strain ATCC 50505) TaxID=993615 RepID=L2GQ68_VITCO|nr:uncharacterized protein VICG_00571 [Vittaforma corneae ATCC 50505]ELA42472.1 hypothetical protein VICG_00571 [Vittaforma corneae ATCC 50505]
MECVRLNSGYEIPTIGLGTWELTDREIFLNALEEAYNLGYRHIDTASFYGNEDIIGEFLKKHDRKEFFITSKLWNTDHSNVLAAINKSLEKLSTDYLDMYLVHWPVNLNGPFDLKSVWTQMEKLVDLNKTKSIGVANFGIKNLTKLLEFCKIKPAILQVELHPYLPQYELREFCEKNQIRVMSYSSLGSSFGGKVILTKDPVLSDVAKRHNCPVQTVILNFLLSEGLLVIPRSKSKEHLKTNMQRIELKDEDMQKIRDIKTRYRYIDPKPFGDHRFD